jgi:MFS family permease
MFNRLPKKIKSGLKYSILDGAAHASMLGIGEHYLLAYAIFLSASDLQLAFVATFPIFIAAIAQLYSVKLMHKMKTRKHAVITFAAIQGLIWIPIILTYFSKVDPVSSLIFFVTLYWVFGLMSNPIWTSWIGDLVPRSIRGKFFGKRSLVASFSVFVSFILGGFILTYAKGTLGDAFIGFAIIFGLALIARMISIVFLIKQYEPKLSADSENEFSLKDFLFHFKKRLKKGHFNTLVLYMSFMSFSIYLSAPYIVANILKELNFTYFQYTIASAAFLITQMLFFVIWGKLSDKYGSLSILKLTGFLMALNPILWLIPRTLSVAIIIQIYAGFAMSGFMLSSFNFMLEVTNPKRRVTSKSYFNLMVGTFTFLGSLAGAGLLKLFQNVDFTQIPILSSVFYSQYIPLFLIGGILRLTTSLYLLPKLKEIEKHEKVTSEKLFLQAVSTVPGKGISIAAHHMHKN